MSLGNLFKRGLHDVSQVGNVLRLGTANATGNQAAAVNARQSLAPTSMPRPMAPVQTPAPQMQAPRLSVQTPAFRPPAPAMPSFHPQQLSVAPTFQQPRIQQPQAPQMQQPQLNSFQRPPVQVAAPQPTPGIHVGSQVITQQTPVVRPNPAPSLMRDITHNPVTNAIGNTLNHVDQRVIQSPVGRGLQTIGLGAARSAIGTAQGASGLYDLAMPGTGTNRISKLTADLGKQVDQTAQAEHSNQPLYHGAQLGTDLATFFAGGAELRAATEGAKALPVVGKGISTLGRVSPFIENKVATKLAPVIENGNVAQRIAAIGAKNIVNPKYQAANAAFTALQSGKEAAQGQQVTPESIGANLAIGGVGFPLAGAMVHEAITPVTNRIAPVIENGIQALKDNHVIAPSRLNKNEVSDLANYAEQKNTGAEMDAKTYNRGIAAAQKAGLHPGDAQGIESLLNAHAEHAGNRVSLAKDQGGGARAGDILPNRAFKHEPADPAAHLRPQLGAIQDKYNALPTGHPQRNVLAHKMDGLARKITDAELYDASDISAANRAAREAAQAKAMLDNQGGYIAPGQIASDIKGGIKKLFKPLDQVGGGTVGDSPIRKALQGKADPNELANLQAIPRANRTPAQKARMDKLILGGFADVRKQFANDKAFYDQFIVPEANKSTRSADLAQEIMGQVENDGMPHSQAIDNSIKAEQPLAAPTSLDNYHSARAELTRIASKNKQPQLIKQFEQLSKGMTVEAKTTLLDKSLNNFRAKGGGLIDLGAKFENPNKAPTASDVAPAAKSLPTAAQSKAKTGQASGMASIKSTLPRSKQSGLALDTPSKKTGVVDKQLRDLQEVHKQLVNAEADNIRPIHQPTTVLNPVAKRVRDAGGISSSAYEDIPKGVIRKAGMSADKVAQELGYNSEDELINALHTEADAKARTLTEAQLKEQALQNLQNGKSQHSQDFAHLQDMIKQRQGELSLYPKGTRSQVKVTTAAPKMTDAELQSLASTPEGMAKKTSNKVVEPTKNTLRNVEADRAVQDVLRKGGTTDEALNAYMQKTGADLQTAVRDVRRVATESKLGFNGGKNPLLGTVKLPEVQAGDHDQAFLNADFVKQHERAIGQDALKAFHGLSEHDKTLLQDIETNTVTNVAKKADNPQAFMNAEKSIRTYYDTRHAYDNALGIDVGYRSNYLRQIFAKAEQEAKASLPDQMNMVNGNKRPGYTQHRTNDTLNTHVGNALERDIMGSSTNHAKLAYSEGLHQAYPGKVNSSGQLVRGENGAYKQITNKYGQAVTADAAIADKINTRTRSAAPTGNLARYDRFNAGMKQVKLGGGAFHAVTEAGTFIGQQLASGKLFKEPKASANVFRSFFSPKFIDKERVRLGSDHITNPDSLSTINRAALAGLKDSPRDVQGDAAVTLGGRASKYTGIQALHDATFKRELPYLKLKTFEQKTKGMSAHNPADLQKMRDIAKGINNEIGGLNRDIGGSITPATFQRTQRFLLATDFTEGKIRTVLSALTKGGEQGKLAREIVIGKALLFGGLTVAGGAAFGDYKGKSGKDTVIAIAKTLLDPSFKAGRYTVALPNTYASEFARPFGPLFKSKNSAGGNATTADRVKGIQKYGINRLAALPSEALQLISNKDASGNRIYGNDYKFKGGAPISPAKTALNVAGTAVPIPASQGISVATGKTAVAPAIANVAGLRVTNEDAYNETKAGPASGTPVAQLLANEKQQKKALKDSLSPEDQELSTLSKADRQKLIDQGKYTQAKFDGLDKYVANRKQQLGLPVTATKAPTQPAPVQAAKSEQDYAKDPKVQQARTNMLKNLPKDMNGNDVATLKRFTGLPAGKKQDILSKEPAAEYKLKLAEFERDKHLGKISGTQMESKQAEVFKAEVGSTFDPEVRKVYGMSKDKATAYLANNPNGNALADKVIAYGDSLAKNGIENNKFVDSKGRVGIIPKGTTIEANSSRISQTAKKNGVPDNIFAALVKQESGGNQSARSPVGAIGLTQLMPDTARTLGVDPTNPDQNLDGGARYLKQMYDKFKSWDLALAAYNAGPAAVEKYHGIPPYAETQNYVKNIMGMVKGGIKGNSLNLVLNDPNAATGGALNQSGVNTTASSGSGKKGALVGSSVSYGGTSKLASGSNTKLKAGISKLASGKARTRSYGNVRVNPVKVLKGKTRSMA